MSTALRLELDPAGDRPLQPFWSFGVNTCHAPLWRRADHAAHLVRARAELGFRYVRCHELLGRNCVKIRPDGGFDFSGMLASLDRLLATGLRPFFGLCTLPEGLARDPARTIAHYRFSCSPPRDWADWHRLVRDAVAACRARYGPAEVREWWFEVWNEPDIDFWTGTQAEYFRLYDLAARAVKGIDPALRLGGPATARTAWLEEFSAHVVRPSPDYGLEAPRCDFISTHLYPSDRPFLDAARGTVRLLDAAIMRERFTAARATVDRHFGPAMPLFIGEWNSSAGPLAANHDECNNGAFVARTLTELEPLCQGSLFWSLTDIYEECGFHHEPFHGGYGLITVNDIPKAPWHVHRLLAAHRGERLGVHLPGAAAGVGLLVSRDAAATRALLYHHAEPEVPGAPAALALPAPWGAAEVEVIAPGAGSAYERWLELGRPAYVNRAVLDALEAASIPARLALPAGGRLALAPGTVAQVTWPRALC